MMSFTLQIQSVVRCADKTMLERSMESLANAVRVARENALELGEVSLVYGDAFSCFAEDEVASLSQKYQAFFALRYHAFAEDAGFARGHNLLAKDCTADALLIVDPEAIVSPQLLCAMYETYTEQSAQVGIIEARQTPMELSKPYHTETLETDWASTACVMIPASVFSSVGGFDEVAENADVDFSNRVREAGKAIYYRPDAVIFLAERPNLNGTVFEAEKNAVVTPNSGKTAVDEYFNWLESAVRKDSSLYRAAHSYLEETRNAPKICDEDAPFLTVITRTQGRRPEMLREALLCMTAQCSRNFELLIMGHNLSETQEQNVKSLLAELPEWMQEKTRLILVCGGTRTTPLNRGFEAARGRYIAVLDDDDLVFDHWVDAFCRLSKENDGMILHQYTAKQDWKTLSGKFSDTPCVAGLLDNFFCRDFHLLWQMMVNSCPLCSMAFPRYAFSEWGVRFDETLNTTEDWDFMMRCAFLTGVANGDELTSLYRIWINAENSQTVHNQEEWLRNHRAIVERFTETPIVLPRGSLKGIVDLQFRAEQSDLTPMDVVPRGVLPRPALYYSDGADFHALKQWTVCEMSDVSDAPIAFCPPAHYPNRLHAIRLIPREHGFFALHDLSVTVEDVDGGSVSYTVDRMGTNGHIVNGTLYFLKNDPHLDVYFEKPIKIRRILVRYRIEEGIPNDAVDFIVALMSGADAELVQEINRFKNSLSYRVKRKLRTIKNKILK